LASLYRIPGVGVLQENEQEVGAVGGVTATGVPNGGQAGSPLAGNTSTGAYSPQRFDYGVPRDANDPTRPFAGDYEGARADLLSGKGPGWGTVAPSVNVDNSYVPTSGQSLGQKLGSKSQSTAAHSAPLTIGSIGLSGPNHARPGGQWDSTDNKVAYGSTEQAHRNPAIANSLLGFGGGGPQRYADYSQGLTALDTPAGFKGGPNNLKDFYPAVMPKGARIITRGGFISGGPSMSSTGLPANPMAPKYYNDSLKGAGGGTQYGKEVNGVWKLFGIRSNEMSGSAFEGEHLRGSEIQVFAPDVEVSRTYKDPKSDAYAKSGLEANEMLDSVNINRGDSAIISFAGTATKGYGFGTNIGGASAQNRHYEMMKQGTLNDPNALKAQREYAKNNDLSSPVRPEVNVVVPGKLMDPIRPGSNLQAGIIPQKEQSYQTVQYSQVYSQGGNVSNVSQKYSTGSQIPVTTPPRTLQDMLKSVGSGISNTSKSYSIGSGIKSPVSSMPSSVSQFFSSKYGW
jgi:hypothetical protein